MVNSQVCIHLGDIGFTTFVIKNLKCVMGVACGVFVAAVKVLLKKPVMEVEIKIDNKTINTKAAMIVIANATKYGSGELINPVGRPDDELFEVVACKKISIHEIFKITVSHAAYDPSKTEMFQSNKPVIKAGKKIHFKIDEKNLVKRMR